MIAKIMMRFAALVLLFFIVTVTKAISSEVYANKNIEKADASDSIINTKLQQYANKSKLPPLHPDVKPIVPVSPYINEHPILEALTGAYDELTQLIGIVKNKVSTRSGEKSYKYSQKYSIPGEKKKHFETMIENAESYMLDFNSSDQDEAQLLEKINYLRLASKNIYTVCSIMKDSGLSCSYESAKLIKEKLLELKLNYINSGTIESRAEEIWNAAEELCYKVNDDELNKFCALLLENRKIEDLPLMYLRLSEFNKSPIVRHGIVTLFEQDASTLFERMVKDEFCRIKNNFSELKKCLKNDLEAIRNEHSGNIDNAWCNWCDEMELYLDELPTPEFKPKIKLQCIWNFYKAVEDLYGYAYYIYCYTYKSDSVLSGSIKVIIDDLDRLSSTYILSGPRDIISFKLEQLLDLKKDLINDIEVFLKTTPNFKDSFVDIKNGTRDDVEASNRERIEVLIKECEELVSKFFTFENLYYSCCKNRALRLLDWSKKLKIAFDNTKPII